MPNIKKTLLAGAGIALGALLYLAVIFIWLLPFIVLIAVSLMLYQCIVMES